MAHRSGDFRRSRRDTGHKPNHERWMISYADLLTLMLALFIVLYATSAQNTSKMNAMASSMMVAFSGTPPSLIQKPSSPHGPKSQLPKAKTLPAEAPPMPKTPAVPQNVHHLDKVSSLPVDRLTQQEQRDLQPSIKAIKALRDKLHSLLQPEIKAKSISIDSTPLSINIQLNAKILFGNGAADLTKGAVKILTPLAQTLGAIPKGYRISIHGYTDNQPIHTKEFPSNWQLSTARALSVVLLFVDNGVAGEALSAEGFSKYHPIASNDTAQGRQQNRRVSIVISAPKPGQEGPSAQSGDPATKPAPERSGFSTSVGNTAGPEAGPPKPSPARISGPAGALAPAPAARPIIKPKPGQGSPDQTPKSQATADAKHG